jgi:hypothetical protein
MMIFNNKPSQYMTSAELEDAIRRRRDHTKKLVVEARKRRAELSNSPLANEVEKPKHS